MLDNKIIELYNKNFSQKRIANILNVSHSYIWRKFGSLGLVAKKYRKYSCNDKYFNNIGEGPCYWAGFIAADGNIYKNQIKIELASRDTIHLKSFKKDVESCSPVKIYSTKSNIVLTSRQMIKSLENIYNIIPRKTYILKPPKKELGEFTRDFIRGYIDGDGCIHSKVPSISLVGTKDMLEWIKYHFQTHCEKIGNPSVNSCGKVYVINFGGRRQVYKIIKWIYSDNNRYRLERKFLKGKEIIRNIDEKDNSIAKRETEVINMYNSGKSMKYISTNTEFKYFRIYRILTTANINIRNTKKKILSKEEKENIIFLRKKGGTIKNISRLSGVSRPKVSEFLRESNYGD